MEERGLGAPVSGSTENVHTDAQGGLHNSAISKPENDNGGAISTQGDSPQKPGCCLETNWGVSSVQTTSEKVTSSSNEAMERNFQPGNKEVPVSTEDGAARRSSCAHENSVVEIGAARRKFSEKPHVNCLRNNCGVEGITNINMDCHSRDLECPEVNNTDLTGSLKEEDRRRISKRFSLQNSEECKETKNGYPLSSSSLKDETKKRKNGKNNIFCNASTSQDSPLPAGIDTYCLMALATVALAENNTPDLKCTESRGKQNQNKVAMTDSFSVDNAKMAHRKSVNVDSTVEKNSVVQSYSFEEKENENVTDIFGSCMLDLNRSARTNVSLISLDGGVGGANVNTNCLKRVKEEKSCQSSVSEGFTKLFGGVPRPYSSEDNQSLGSIMHRREAIPCPSFISNVRENALTNLPSEYQRYQLDPFNHGANFFQMQQPVSNGGSDVRENALTILPSEYQRYQLDPFNQGASFFQMQKPVSNGVSDVREHVRTILPSEYQRYQLDPFNQGASFFHMQNPVSGGVSDVRYGVHFFESGTMGTPEYEFGISNLDCTIVERNKCHEEEAVCLSTEHNINCICPSAFAYSPRQFLKRFLKKKLLILDLNGLLADINQDHHNAHLADAKIRGKLVFRRPYCYDFLNFCIQNFEIGIWSSRKRANVDSVVDILMRDFKPYLLFCWDLSKCTFTGHKTLENKHKPLVLKELRKLWSKEEPDLPWKEGDFSPSNTLLVDDSPYKALRNPPYTAIFPHSYNYLNWNDNSLGPGGDLRVYLENLAVAEDVGHFVRHNPFGQPFITQSDPDWKFYSQIADKGSIALTCRV